MSSKERVEEAIKRYKKAKEELEKLTKPKEETHSRRE
jgi:prefoldin subunit 5